jgi:hypothetical protein
MVMVLLVATYSMRPNWWNFLDIFFLFMMAFSHAISLMISRFNKFAGQRLEIIAAGMAVLGVIALIVNFAVL